MVPEALGKGCRIKRANSPLVPSPVFTSPANPSRWKRISRAKSEIWKAVLRKVGRKCKEPVPPNPRVAETTDKLVQINHLCHRQNTICLSPSLEKEQPASQFPAGAELSLHSLGLSNEMQFNQLGPSMLNLWTASANISLEKVSVVPVLVTVMQPLKEK